jgi:hypothetical protein
LKHHIWLFPILFPKTLLICIHKKIGGFCCNFSKSFPKTCCTSNHFLWETRNFKVGVPFQVKFSPFLLVVVLDTIHVAMDLDLERVLMGKSMKKGATKCVDNL